MLPGTWPKDMSPEYGETELKRLCDKFLMPFTSVLKNDYRDFKESLGSNAGLSFTNFQYSTATVPVSAAVCERGFSKMNIVCSALRSTLSMQHMASLLFISITGPPLSAWQPYDYVKSWLAKGRRHANAATCAVRKQRDSSDDSSMQQIWNLF